MTVAFPFTEDKVLFSQGYYILSVELLSQWTIDQLCPIVGPVLVNFSF